MAFLEWLVTLRTEWLTSLFRFVTYFGGWEFLIFFPPVLYWCWRKREGFYFILIVITTLCISTLLKEVFALPRPPRHLWLVSAHGYSFPSGHSVTAAVVWGWLAFTVRRRWFSTFCVVTAGLVALSRMYLGVHYLRDVLSGITIGIVCLHAAMRLIGRWGKAFDELHWLTRIGAFLALGICLPFLYRHPFVADASALLAGVGCGYVLEQRLVGFDAIGVWWKRGLRIVVGGLSLYFLYTLAVKKVFSDGLFLIWVAFFGFALYFTLFLPWLFVKLGLATRE